MMKTSRFLAGLPCFSATKARGGRLRGRARISEPTAPRRRKRAVDQAIESSHHTQSERHIGSHRPASLSTRQTMVLQSHLSKLLCFRYASAMTKFEYIYEIAADNHGLITSAQAGEAGISNNELVQYAKRGRIAKVGHGIYQPEQWVPDPSDTYAWAVMSVGPDALLFGESIIAMLGLAPANPTRMFVATPRRTRRKLPNSIKVEWLRGIKPTATYNGIPCQSAQDA